MKRSNLTTKYTVGNVGKFEKAYKERMKKESDKPFTGNAIVAVTIGVVQSKRMPEISDCLTLIKLGNNNCDDEQAEAILTRWLEDEDNQERGLAGAFADLCKDLCIDIPYSKQFVEQLNSIEEMIGNLQALNNMVTDLLGKAQSLKKKMESPGEVPVIESKETEKN